MAAAARSELLLKKQRDAAPKPVFSRFLGKAMAKRGPRGVGTSLAATVVAGRSSMNSATVMTFKSYRTSSGVRCQSNCPVRSKSS